ncbi:MAG: adenylyl-sulfate kinase, partial [Candidatus Aminicenantes bacterium]|nr:adenylyl-sulfate kinase [Candidatus Aminicenantes bacterium]
ASFISPYKESRDEIRQMIKENFIEIYVKASVESCKRRDTKGMYLRAEKGEIQNFTGISDVYEEPRSPALVLDTETLSAEQCTQQVINYIEKHLLKR